MIKLAIGEACRRYTRRINFLLELAKKIVGKIGSDQANHLIIIKLCYNFSIKTGRYSIFWGRKERYRKLKTNSSKVGWVVAELQKF